MEPWQERVVEERGKLVEKHSKLEDYISSGAIRILPLEEQALLYYQELLMKAYANVLGERMSNFK